MSYKTTKIPYTREGQLRFAKLIKCRMGDKSDREVAREINTHFGETVISHANINRHSSGKCLHAPDSETVRIFAEYLQMPAAKIHAILEGREYVELKKDAPRTFEETIELLSLAPLSMPELLRIAATISVHAASGGEIDLMKACV